MVYRKAAGVIDAYAPTEEAQLSLRGIDERAACSPAGGLTEKATQCGITVKRSTGHPGTQRLEATLSMTLQPNDVLYIKESMF